MINTHNISHERCYGTTHPLCWSCLRRGVESTGVNPLGHWVMVPPIDMMAGQCAYFVGTVIRYSSCTGPMLADAQS